MMRMKKKHIPILIVKVKIKWQGEYRWLSCFKFQMNKDVILEIDEIKCLSICSMRWENTPRDSCYLP